MVSIKIYVSMADGTPFLRSLTFSERAKQGKPSRFLVSSEKSERTHEGRFGVSLLVTSPPE